MFSRFSTYLGKKAPSSKAEEGQFSGYSSLQGSSASSSATAEKVFKALGTFYWKPSNSARFEPLTALEVSTIEIVSRGFDDKKRPVFHLLVFDPEEDGEPALDQPLEHTMELTFHHDTGAVMWQCVYGDALRELCFRFSHRGLESRSFVEVYNRCVYASLVGGSVSQGEDDESGDVAYVQGTFSREQPIREASPEPQPAPSAGQNNTNTVKKSNNNDSDADVDELFTFDTARARSVAPSAKASNHQNLCFADSVQFHRVVALQQDTKNGSYMARAFTYDESGFGGSGEGFVLEEMAKLKINSDRDNQSLMGADERNFFALHDGGGIVDIDLSRGAVVAEYKANDAKFKPIAITHRSKFSDVDPNLICCLANNVAFSIDKRLDPSKCVAVEEGKDTSDYALGSLKKPMTCHATSAKGHLVIGDTVGDVRLYTGPPGTRRAAGGYHPKTAKTLLKGTPNMSIVSIDITADGKYVVAATSEHLMLFPLEYLEKGKPLNGCEARMGKSKPNPLRLVPTADQTRQMRSPPKFTSVRFDADKNNLGGQWIVATCNDFILTWRMESVVKALANNRAVLCDGAREDGAVRQVDMRGGNTVTFMTENTIGTEKRGEKTVKKGFGYLI